MSSVWRSPKEEHDPKCIVPTVKYGDDSVKVWGRCTWHDVGNLVFVDGNMTENMYKDILKENLIQSGKKLNLGKNMAFQLDMLMLQKIGLIKKVLNT